MICLKWGACYEIKNKRKNEKRERERRGEEEARSWSGWSSGIGARQSKESSQSDKLNLGILIFGIIASVGTVFMIQGNGGVRYCEEASELLWEYFL